MASTAGEVNVKLVLVGAPGSGRSELLHAFAARMGGIPVRDCMIGSTRVRRLELIWLEPMSDGRLMRVRVFAPTGPITYNAVEQLLMQEVDGVVMLFDVSPEMLPSGQEALHRLADNLRRADLEFGETPMTVQYHRADRHNGFSPGQMDEWIGLPTAQIQRFVSTSETIDAPDGAIDTLLAKIAKRIVASPPLT